MKILSVLLFSAMFAMSPAVFSQEAPPGDGVPNVPEIAPSPAAKGDSEKCRHDGMGKMAHAGMKDMGGMNGCCKSRSGSQTQGGCEKCRQGGMDHSMHAGMGDMQHGGAGGMACCGGRGEGGQAALERRVAELEKRLDLIQQLLLQTRSH